MTTTMKWKMEAWNSRHIQSIDEQCSNLELRIDRLSAFSFPTALFLRGPAFLGLHSGKRLLCQLKIGGASDSLHGRCTVLALVLGMMRRMTGCFIALFATHAALDFAKVPIKVTGVLLLLIHRVMLLSTVLLLVLLIVAPVVTVRVQHRGGRHDDLAPKL